MGNYLASASGRTLLLTAGVAVAGAGLMSLPGVAPFALSIISVVCIATVVGWIFALGLGSGGRPGPVIALIVGLPLLAGFYLAALFALTGRSAALGVVLLALAGGLFAVAGWEWRRASILRTPLAAAHR